MTTALVTVALSATTVMAMTAGSVSAWGQATPTQTILDTFTTSTGTFSVTPSCAATPVSASGSASVGGGGYRFAQYMLNTCFDSSWDVQDDSGLTTFGGTLTSSFATASGSAAASGAPTAFSLYNSISRVSAYPTASANSNASSLSWSLAHGSASQFYELSPVECGGGLTLRLFSDYKNHGVATAAANFAASYGSLSGCTQTKVEISSTVCNTILFSWAYPSRPALQDPPSIQGPRVPVGSFLDYEGTIKSSSGDIVGTIRRQGVLASLPSGDVVSRGILASSSASSSSEVDYIYGTSSIIGIKQKICVTLASTETIGVVGPVVQGESRVRSFVRGRWKC